MKQMLSYAAVAFCTLILMLAYDARAQRGPSEFFGGSFVNVLRGPSGSGTLPTYSFTGATTTGMFRIPGAALGFALGGGERFRLTTAAATLGSALVLGWGSSAASSSIVDVSLARSAADTLTLGTGDNLVIPAQASASGVRFLCISTTGAIVSQESACVGT